jgi:tetratricopeptide (TPR) repeat protein
MSEILAPEGLSREGSAAYQGGRFAEAAQLFEQAARGFDAAGQKANAAEARNNASVAFLKAGDAAEALRTVQGTVEVFEVEGDIRRQGMAFANLASALEGLGKLDEALERYEQSSALLRQIGEKEMRAVVLKSISALQIRTGKQFQALASMDSALENQPRLSLREKLLHKLLRIPLDMLKRR